MWAHFCVSWTQQPQISRANSLIYALLHINKSGKHKTFDKSGWVPMRPSDVCCLHLRRHTQWQCHSACLRVKVNQHFSAWELILNYKNCHQVIKKASLLQKDVAMNWRKNKQSTGIFSPVIFAPIFWPSKSMSKPRPRYQICVLHFPPELLILWWGTSIAGGDHLL